MGYKWRCLNGEHGGEPIRNLEGTPWEHIRNLEGTPWEHIGKHGKMKKKILPAPQT